MNKLFLLAFMALFPALLPAQSLPPTGFYRVQNVKSSRYITIIDAYGALNLSSSDADMGALRTFAYSEDRVVTNPASVIYAVKSGSNSYDLQAQGTGAYAIVKHLLQLNALADGTYAAYASVSGGITKYLYEYKSDFGNYGGVGINEWQNTNKALRWNVLPISSSDANNYFGIKPDLQIGSDWYKSFYAAFGFSFASQGMEAFYIKKADAARGMAVYEKITGNVPSATPIFVKCASAQPTNNRLNLIAPTGSGISGNVLKGVYFCNTPEEAASKKHENFVLYDENTMRVLGTTSDGSLGFVKAPDSSLFIEKGKKYLPCNTAYLTVAAGSPAEYKIVSQEEYDKPQVITVTADNVNRVYGDANPTFTYTANGTFSGTPELKCEATPESPVGTYTITVGQGTVTGATIVGVSGTLTVTKAPLTVTAKSYSIMETAELPTFDATYSGFKNGETESVLTKKATLTCNVPADKAPGTYTITAAGAEALNYSFSYVNGTLTVTQAPTITIRAKAATMVYGDAVPELEYTVEGGTLNGTPVLKCEATSQSPVGEYAITVEKGTVSYPRLDLKGAVLTVTQAPLTVTAKSYTIVETDELPTFEATYSGFKNGETESVLTKKATLTCNVPADKAPGTYTITAAGAEAQNYSFSYVNGTLTVTQAPTITIRAKAATMVYGDAVPELEYTVEGGIITGTPVLKCEATSLSPVGEYAITVEKGTMSYPRLKFENAMLTVTKAPLTVTAKSYTIVETDELPTYEAIYSGFKNGETESVLTKKAALTCNVPSDKAPGTYTITAADAEAQNYSLSYVNGTLTVTQAPTITIRAKAATMVYGDAVPALEYTVEGGTITGTPVLKCEATSQSPVGEYAITVEKGTVSYPRLTFENAMLTVTKAMLTVTAIDASRMEGEENPEFTLTYSGFKNGETEDVLTTKPVATTIADAQSAPGTYAITVSGGNARNYDFTYVSGTLTVTEKPVMIITVDDDENSNTETLIIDDETGTAEIIGVESQSEENNVKTVNIPETVTVTTDEGVGEYTVTKIAESAFEGMTTIESVTIPSTIVEIGDNAFKDCSGLQKLVVNIEEPLDLTPSAARATDNTADYDDSDPVFQGVDKETCVLFVPVGSKEKYKAAPVWRTFKNIYDMNEQGIALMTVGTAANGTEVYTLSGMKVRTDSGNMKSLPAGIYVVGGKKVVVK